MGIQITPGPVLETAVQPHVIQLSPLSWHACEGKFIIPLAASCASGPSSAKSCSQDCPPTAFSEKEPKVTGVRRGTMLQ